MPRTTITVTEAARNFAECVNRAHYQNTTFVLLRNGSPVARIIPDGGKLCDGRDLARAVAKIELLPSEAKAWQRDVASARKRLKSPTSKW